MYTEYIAISCLVVVTQDISAVLLQFFDYVNQLVLTFDFEVPKT